MLGWFVAFLYTNENFPLPAALELRRLGHDVMTIQESGHAGESLSDEAVLSFAIAEERTLVTLNRQYFVRLHAMSPAHAGIIVCSFDGDFVALAARVDAVLRDRLPLPGRQMRVNRPT
jgi:hypothetical protein